MYPSLFNGAFDPDLNVGFVQVSLSYDAEFVQFSSNDQPGVVIGNFRSVPEPSMTAFCFLGSALVLVRRKSR